MIKEISGIEPDDFVRVKVYGHSERCGKAADGGVGCLIDSRVCVEDCSTQSVDSYKSIGSWSILHMRDLNIITESWQGFG